MTLTRPSSAGRPSCHRRSPRRVLAECLASSPDNSWSVEAPALRPQCAPWFSVPQAVGLRPLGRLRDVATASSRLSGDETPSLGESRCGSDLLPNEPRNRQAVGRLRKVRLGLPSIGSTSEPPPPADPREAGVTDASPNRELGAWVRAAREATARGQGGLTCCGNDPRRLHATTIRLPAERPGLDRPCHFRGWGKPPPATAATRSS